MLKFRNFDKTDYRNYPSADKFSDGTEPMICEFEENAVRYTILLHADTTYDYKNCLVIIEDNGTNLSRFNLLSTPTKRIAGFIAGEIINYLNEEDGTYSNKLNTMMNLFRFDKF